MPNASIANTIATGFTNSVAVSVRANNSPSMTVLSNGVITLRRPPAEDAADRLVPTNPVQNANFHFIG